MVMIKHALLDLKLSRGNQGSRKIIFAQVKSLKQII
jgi:hypothetical protein